MPRTRGGKQERIKGKDKRGKSEKGVHARRGRKLHGWPGGLAKRRKIASQKGKRPEEGIVQVNGVGGTGKRIGKENLSEGRCIVSEKNRRKNREGTKRVRYRPSGNFSPETAGGDRRRRKIGVGRRTERGGLVKGGIARVRRKQIIKKRLKANAGVKGHAILCWVVKGH